jgi:integrase
MKTRLSIADYHHSKSTPFLVVVPRALTGTKRVRKYFKTREEAQVYIFRVLDPEIGFTRADLRARGIGLNGHKNKTRIVSRYAYEWIGRFLKQKPMFFQVRQVLQPLMKRFGRQPIESIGVPELDGWLRSLETQYAYETRKNYWRRTRQFFTYCHNSGYISSNPMMNPILKQPIRRERAKRYILKPEQMAKCLTGAEGDRRLTAYLCLGGFAGLRTCEILAIDWDDLLWDVNEIRVTTAKRVETSETKDIWIGQDNEDEDKDEDISGDRLVTMEPALRRHLEPIALKGMAINAAGQRRPDGGRGSRKIVPGGQRTLYELRAKLRDVLTVQEWPDNCLRHSYKSFHLAYYRDLERTRHEMGHSHSNTTKYKYGSPRLKVVAEQWWAL